MSNLIYLFTDFGLQGPYLGQVEGVLLEALPEANVINLLSNAPAFDSRRGSYLLDALAGQLPETTAILAVVDPGVGSQRRALVVESGRRILVGPDNGLLSFSWRKNETARVFSITPGETNISPSFHGRDLFAPALANMLKGDRSEFVPVDPVDLVGSDWLYLVAEIIYLDTYGNAFTGIPARELAKDQLLLVKGVELSYARTFSEVQKGQPFWYENSCGLVEISVNQGRAEDALDLVVGSEIQIKPAF